MKILFIKSTSLQHLALSFEKVIERFTHHSPLTTHHLKIDVLSHPHAIDSLKGFGFINRIITYNNRGNFSPFNISVKDIRKGGYDVVVVPFNNISGAGYENVMALAVCLGAKQIATCNRLGEIKAINIKKALLSAIKGYSYYPLAFVMTPIMFVISVMGILLQGAINVILRAKPEES
jgi:hypothetical protein